MLLRSSRPHRARSRVPFGFIFGLAASLIAADPSDASEPETAADPGVAPIAWRSDYASALQEAQARNRPLWIQFTGPWCPNCTRMEQDSYPHPAIREHASRSFIPVKLRTDVYESLALSFDLSGLPATVIVAPSRTVLHVHQGYLGPDDLDAVLRTALARHQPPVSKETELAARREQGKADQRSPSRGADSTAVANAEASSKPKAVANARAKKESELALSGYCPVSLVSDKRLVQGQVAYTVTHEGRLYRFANMLTFNLFRRDPQRFVPVNNGNCPVAQLDRGVEDPGNPQFGVLYEGRLFLCSSQADRKRFLEQPVRYAAVDVAERGFCPHCLANDGLLVRGDPRFHLDREGKRFWFPDPSHLQAYLAAAPADSTRR